jgi:hypothetical protein
VTVTSAALQTDADTGRAVACECFVTFGGGPEVVGVVVSLLDDTSPMLP